jgi:hypothetical protein
MAHTRTGFDRFFYGGKWATQIYVYLVHDVTQIKKHLPQPLTQQDNGDGMLLAIVTIKSNKHNRAEVQ